MSEHTRAERERAWLAVTAVAVGHLAVDAAMGVWPVFKVLAHLDLRVAGAIATAATLAGNSLQLVFGYLADRGHRRTLIALGVVAAGLVCFLPWATGVATLVVLVLVAAAGSAAFHPAGAGHAGVARTGRPGIAVALYLTGGYVGFAASQLAYAGAFRALGGRMAILFAAPLALGGALLLTGRARNGLPAAGGSLPGRTAAQTPATAIRWGKLAALFAIQGFSACVGVAVQFLTPELFGGAGTTLAMGGAHCLATLAGAAALFPAGAARDRFGARPVLFAANVLAGLALGLLALRGAQDRGLALALVLVFTFANAANTVVALAEGMAGLSRAGSSVSALLMGVPWLLAAPAPSVAALLAHPARGGTPAVALGWMALCSPAAAAVALLLPGAAAATRASPTTAAPRPPT